MQFKLAIRESGQQEAQRQEGSEDTNVGSTSAVESLMREQKHNYTHTKLTQNQTHMQNVVARLKVWIYHVLARQVT